MFCWQISWHFLWNNHKRLSWDQQWIKLPKCLYGTWIAFSIIFHAFAGKIIGKMEESIHVIIFLAFQNQHKSKRRLLNNSLQAPSENRSGKISSPNHAKEKENCSYFPFSSPFIISPLRVFPPVPFPYTQIEFPQPSLLSFPAWRQSLTKWEAKKDAFQTSGYERKIPNWHHTSRETGDFFLRFLYFPTFFFLLCFHSSFSFTCRPLTVRANAGEPHCVCERELLFNFNLSQSSLLTVLYFLLLVRLFKCVTLTSFARLCQVWANCVQKWWDNQPFRPLVVIRAIYTISGEEEICL